MERKNGKKFWVTVLIVAVLAAAIASASVVSAIATHIGSQPQTGQKSHSATESADEQRLNAQLYTATHNRSRWLFDLLNASGKASMTDSGNARLIFETARGCGVIGNYAEEEMYLPLNRLFVAQTMVRALGYKQRSAGRITDITAMQSEMSTVAYYGYFLPDVNGMIYPERGVSAAEYDGLMTELDRYRVLKGKRILSFGDSIMYGTGNNGEGIADMLAEKYGMTASDYSVPGATMGLINDADHIHDQIARAAGLKEQADIILLNGGTNDMNRKTALGNLSAGFDMATREEGSFTGGFEKVMWALRRQWNGVPVVYIRAHNMKLGTEERERLYGERGLAVAEKWSAAAVDLYTDTDFNTEDASISARYTFLSPREGNLPDSVHPTAIGYAKYYLPLISEAVENSLTRSSS